MGECSELLTSIVLQDGMADRWLDKYICQIHIMLTTPTFIVIQKQRQLIGPC